MRQWRWQLAAQEFLTLVREEAAVRRVEDENFARWLAWAEAYVEGRGVATFFAQWAPGPSARR